MKKITDRVYECDEGKVFIRIKDQFIMGPVLDLGVKDSIKKYEEIDDPRLEEGSEESEI